MICTELSEKCSSHGQCSFAKSVVNLLGGVGANDIQPALFFSFISFQTACLSPALSCISTFFSIALLIKPLSLLSSGLINLPNNKGAGCMCVCMHAPVYS